MTETTNTSGIELENLDDLSPDSSIIEPTQDRLGYAPFASHLADSICKMNFPEGFVIAVYGPWGSGKSTLLNFLAYYLKQRPESEQPIIVPFNPWLFSGDEDITRRFINQLQSVLSQLKAVPKGFKSRLANFAKVVSEIPLPYAQAGKAVVRLFDDEEKVTSDLKEELEDTLLKQHPRIVIAIDDIDRLAADDIKKLFRVINAIPNFTNVVYFLVFNKEVVSQVLAEAQGITGEDYLQKIVQASFDLPTPDKTLLRRLLFEKLDSVLADTPKHLFDQTHWGNVYFQGIDYFITKIRDIVRLTNTLTVTYSAFKDEVNPIDCIAIETLRVFRPKIYEIIRKNPKFFAGRADSEGSIIPSVEDLKHFHNSWVAQLQEEDKEPVKRLLLRLFPKLEAVWRNTYYDSSHELTWRQHLRVCSLEIFPIYFRLVLTEGEISDIEMQAILISARDANAFGKTLIELANQKRPDGTTQVRTFLEYLEDYTEKEIPANCIASIVQAFFDVGDQVLSREDEGYGMFDFGNDIRIGRIVSQLLRRLDKPVRFEVLKEAIANGNALAVSVREVITLGQEQGKYGADEASPKAEWLIDVEHFKELEEIALTRLRNAAQQNSLLQVPKLPENLGYWQSLTGAEEVRQWVEKMIEDDEGLVSFLDKFLETGSSKYKSEPSQKTGYKLDPEWLEPYFDPSLIIDRVRSLDEQSGLTADRQTAVKQFIQEYDMKQQGKDPNDAKSWEEEQSQQP